MRRFLQSAVISSMGLVCMLGYQNCTKVKGVQTKIVAKGSLSKDWKDVQARK